MPHTHSRQSFHSVATNPAVPELVRLYSSLVTLEVMLKDALLAVPHGEWKEGHNIHGLMVMYDGALGVLGGQLATAISALHCTDKIGNTVNASGNNYPHIRYLCHQLDAFVPSSPQALITNALNIALQCLQQLNQQGVNP